MCYKLIPRAVIILVQTVVFPLICVHLRFLTSITSCSLMSHCCMAAITSKGLT